MAGTKLAMTIERGRQQLDIAFRDDDGKPAASMSLGRQAVESLLAQLVAARDQLKPGAAQNQGVPVNGAVRLPPPIEYYTMTAGVDQASGLPVLGFKVGPDLWLSFRIEAEGVSALAKLMTGEAAKAGRA
ncbi:MAG: hypothetical protein IT534_09400 [Bauldia sp.]|nr:hypothetical protein [Bauldia sp.]